MRTKVGSKQIAEELHIPAPFFSKDLTKINEKNITSSVKGPHIGFYLTKKNKTKTLFEIIGCIDGLHKFESCFLGQQECNNKNLV